ncbi:putative disease resistance protein RGA4 [Quercus robur]|uniref:putative disease resistance protein RGA4 n=1 Tax=Quercus robur TaxID=38942 RepID=UPI00216242F4|nr:putative disease resistance protein RGA4 [Quercus robur]
MAEGTIIEVFEVVIGKSGNLADQIGLSSRVKNELEKIRETVSIFGDVIQKAEESVWLRELKDAVYEADNLLEEFSNEVSRRDLMAQNKEAKKSLGDTSRGLGERDHYFVRSEEVIGRENDKKAIIGIPLDLNVEENVSVLPIVGSGGLGKTTLAKLVFNDEEIGNHFEIRLWVCVSDGFDIKRTVQKILNSAKGERKEALEMNTLINDLHQEIDGRRYLLVLDDVWNEDYEKWNSLKGVLQRAARGSRMLVTTRLHMVARITQTIQPYVLGELSPHDSWLLFERYAFKEGEEPDFGIKEIGMKIVEKCRGVPLAIKIVGDILRSKCDVREWFFFLDSEHSGVTQEENGILSTLKLIYNHLPSHLKQCCAYCSLFPKDYNINKQTLIRLWMAQGFIKSSHPDLEDVGHQYFLELIWRSFFKVVAEDKLGNTSFKIHHLIHDLLTSVAGQESAIIGTDGEHIADAERTRHLAFGFHLGSSSLTNTLFQTSNLRTFLLCGQQLGEHENGLNESTCDAIFSCFKFLRVLDLHGTGINTVPSSISKLNHVRCLDLSDNRLIEMLPQSLSRLQNLQTLKLSRCVQLKELPRDISRLVNLRILEIDGCWDLIHMPHGLGQLTNLQTLSQFVISKDTSSVSRNNGELEELDRLNGELKELNTLNNLRGTLEIVNLRRGKDAEAESKATNLRGMEHLQGLKLRWIEDEVDKVDVVFDETSLEALQPHPNLKLLSLYRYMGVGFPNWLSSLTNLVEFTLFGCKKCQQLLLLYQFPSLKALELDSLSALEYISHSEEFSNSSLLSSLEELKIKYCPNLKGWKQRGDSIDDDNSTEIATTTTAMAGNHMPPSFSRLSKLCIQACPQLVSMPLFPFLENLELYYCSFKPLEQTTRIAAAEATVVASASSSTRAASSFAPLSKLKSMEIGRMEKPLPEECMQNLISLDRLWIYECRGPLLQGMRHLTALNQLEICSSELFDLSNYGMEWKGLRSLDSLWLFRLLKLEFLPEGIQHVTSLRKLTIDYCPCLTALSEWIFSLTSLEILEILQCPKL